MKQQSVDEKSVDLIECNISRNNHIAYDVQSSNFCVIACVAL